MQEKINKLNNYLLFPGALVALIAGLVSVYKDTSWYIYIPLFAITLTFIILTFFESKEIHEFEVIWQEITIDVIDKLGNEVFFTNHAKFKALRSGAHNFDYILYCDGDIDNILTKEGSVTEIIQESGRFLVKTNIESPVGKGEQIEHTLTAKYLNAFTKEKEYWETSKNTPGTKIKFTILTNMDRPIKEFRAYKILGHAKILLSQQPKRILANGKQGIILDFEQAKFLERYRLEWTW